MSDHEDPLNRSADPSDGAPSKRRCMIDTPPVASTPDDGSDFYNTPMAAGTPVIKPSSENAAAATEHSTASEKAPMIPGLGLVSPTDQRTTNDPDAVMQELDAPEVKQDAEEPSMEMESKETVFKQESSSEVAAAAKLGPSDKGHDQKEPATALSEAMDVDRNPEQNNPEDANGAPVAQPDSEQQEEEHPEWEVDSSPYESSSDSSSSDSDDSDDEDYPILSPEEQARILMLAEGGSDDEGEGKGKAGGFIRSANEVVEDVLPIPDVKITPEMKIVLLGKVQTVIDNALLIEANTSGEYQVLESGSLLCSKDRVVVGVVTETLGRVENPLYTVMYSTAAEVQERGLSKDMSIYYVESLSTFVFTQPLKGLKGSDASNFHDEEVAEDEIEFSDDEAEADYRRRLKQKRQDRKDARDGGSGRGKRGPPGPSKLSHTELNYDDQGGEDGYTPLARPKNLHEMMGGHEAPIEGGERGPGFRGGRGRGRGSDRGRGGRGRGGGGRGGPWERDQDRRSHRQQSGSSHYGQPSVPAPPQPQPAGYAQQPYQQQQPVYGMPQPFAAYPQYAPQQQGQFAQGSAPTQFPFQFPFQQPFGQPNSFPSTPPGAHINPLFLAALQQQQQQQPYQQPQQAPGQEQSQNPAMNFDQVKAQLDLLRSLSNQNQGPPPS